MAGRPTRFRMPQQSAAGMQSPANVVHFFSEKGKGRRLGDTRPRYTMVDDILKNFGTPVGPSSEAQRFARGLAGRGRVEVPIK